MSIGRKLSNEYHTQQELVKECQIHKRRSVECFELSKGLKSIVRLSCSLRQVFISSDRRKNCD
jgi:hypothetical protein